jgi:hypothetical protein
MGENTKEWGGEEYQRSSKNVQKTLLTTPFFIMSFGTKTYKNWFWLIQE